MSRMDKIKSQVLKMKGKSFTIKLSNGKTYRGSVVGIRGNQVIFKASKGSRTQQIGSFFFFFPFPFFGGLFDGIFL